MSVIYAILYINVNEPDLSDVLQLCTTKEEAVLALLEAAHFRKENEDKVTQYFENTTEYDSYTDLVGRIANEMQLVDSDIYRIVPIELTT